MFKHAIVSTPEEFVSITSSWTGRIALDCETYGTIYEKEKRKLLGVSLAPQASASTHAIYIPLWVFSGGEWADAYSLPLREVLVSYLKEHSFTGHNFTYDKRWLQEALGVQTTWSADTRLMWHLQAPDQRQYGLKEAQKKLLGWQDKGDVELAENVALKGGKLSNGDHYLADLNVLAKYACLDAYSTIQSFNKLAPFFNEHAYWPFLRDIMAYQALLDDNTYLGVGVDAEGLLEAHRGLIEAKEKASRQFHKMLKNPIDELENDWVALYVSKLSRKSAIALYESTPARWKKFNLNSDPDKRELFYHKLGFEQLHRTKPTKKAKKPKPLELSTNSDALLLSSKGHPCMEPYLTYEKANTLSSNFTGPYIDSLVDSRLHPGFNITGTVSYRLSGFKPYLLNAPFDEKDIMRHMRVEDGYTGVHADLAAIEPTVTAHYSEDKSLLKVFRDGNGDIYLDLALELFPTDKELYEGYSPNIPVTKAVKERFDRQRKIAKVIQLAVQYTGTEHTVSKNLTKKGFPTSLQQARNYVGAYWRKFHAVYAFNQKLHTLYAQEGHLRNLIGRIVQVPSADYKDLPNRFIQSSAHDVLVIWVRRIYELCEQRGISIRPILLDCHDSTSNSCPTEQVAHLEQAYDDALAWVNTELGLSVTIRAERKRFHTLAGLKAQEEI